jgi:hypothetical protein
MVLTACHLNGPTRRDHAPVLLLPLQMGAMKRDTSLEVPRKTGQDPRRARLHAQTGCISITRLFLVSRVIDCMVIRCAKVQHKQKRHKYYKRVRNVTGKL